MHNVAMIAAVSIMRSILVLFCRKIRAAEKISIRIYNGRLAMARSGLGASPKHSEQNISGENQE